MSLATAITIFGLINTLLAIAKEAPAVLDEAKSLLEKVEPYALSAGGDVLRMHDMLKHQLP